MSRIQLWSGGAVRFFVRQSYRQEKAQSDRNYKGGRLRFTKALASPGTNEVFRAATLQFNCANSDGKPSDVRTIELTNGKIADIKPSKDSSGKRCEDVTLVYEGLLVNGIPDGIIPYSMSA